MRRNNGSWAGILLPTLAIAVLAGALVQERRASAMTAQRWETYEDHLARMRVIDELTGSRIPSIAVTDLDGRHAEFLEVAGGHPAWVLDPESCPSCLDQVFRWNSSLETDGPHGILIMTNLSRERATELRDGAGIRVPIWVDEPGIIRESLGLRLPSTHLFVDSSGVVLLVDTHSALASCAWSFPAQAAALVAGADASRLK